jgi:hypothetical protein
MGGMLMRGSAGGLKSHSTPPALARENIPPSDRRITGANVRKLNPTMPIRAIAEPSRRIPPKRGFTTIRPAPTKADTERATLVSFHADPYVSPPIAVKTLPIK